MADRTHPSRLSTIARWVATQGWEGAQIEALPGDVSRRRYFRARRQAATGDRPGGATSAIVAYYPVVLRPVCRRFRRTAALLAEVAVPTPAILTADCRRGLMMVADAGERTLYEERRDFAALAPLYRTAVAYVRRLQTLPPTAVADLNPALGERLLGDELRKSWELFLAPRGLIGPPALADRLAAALAVLCAELGRPARLVPCHRDFMPRNLMVAGERLLVLDHQDLRLGPPGYDLASLLNDSLFPPAALERELLAELLPGPAGELDYRRAVVQRCLKAVGTYCDFARRGFDRHLPLVAPTLARAWRAFAVVPELAPLVPELAPAWRQALGGDLLD